MGSFLRFITYVGWGIASGIVDAPNSIFVIGLLALAVVDLSHMCE